MAQKGLTGERVVVAASALIEQHGSEGFSMRLLADTLGVKAASLYNHIESMEALLLEVCRLYLVRQEQAALLAVGEAKRDEAVSALACAYYRFAREHMELYRLMMRTSAVNSTLLNDAAVRLTDPLKTVMEDYAIAGASKVHFRRMLRAVIHGFVSEEDAGFFSHYPARSEESFHFSVRCFIGLLNQAERKALS